MAPSPKPAGRKHPFERVYLLAFVVGCFFFLALWNSSSRSHDPGFDNELHKKFKAVVVLKGTAGVNGTIHLTQIAHSATTHITGTIQGLDPNSLRGFHIHAQGDITEGCTSTGAHYNPFGKHHGGPKDSERHVGDLGNVQADADGVANVDIADLQVQLRGPWSVVGRAMVVHAGTDDLGTQNNEGSRTTGNAGGRAACGVIGLAVVE